MKTERRFLSSASAPVKVRSRADGGKTIEGYGAVFYSGSDAGTEYELANWGGYRILERIMPGAFDRAIREKDDARGLFNHNPSFLLGRVSAGTMRLSVDERGLKYEIDVPDTQMGRDTVISIERGDLSGSSFAFTPRRTVWIEEQDRDIRQIEDLELFDTGPVTYPAYEATTTGVRSADLAPLKTEWEGWRQHRSIELFTADAVAVRARMVELGLTDSGTSR